jgi:hypothetical protein
MKNLGYVGQIPKSSDYDVEEMSFGERKEFLVWYEKKSAVISNSHVLESYCQDDITVLRQAYIVFRGEFMLVGNIDVFQETVTIASAFNKLLRKLFMKPDTIGLIPTGGYTGNVNYSKAMMWLVYREQTDGCHTLHGRNGREYRLPELPNLSVDGFCAETKTVINLKAVIGMVTHVNHSATSLQWPVTR